MTISAHRVLPRTVAEVAQAVTEAYEAGLHIAVRGAGQSYGDIAVVSDEIVLDSSKLDRIEKWTPETGEMIVQAGVTIDQIWRRSLQYLRWPHVVPGTSKVTAAGALALGVHGKNHFCAGCFGDHVSWVEIILSNGELRRFSAADPEYRAICGAAGLIGVIVRLSLQLKEVQSPMVRVTEVKSKNLADSLSKLDDLSKERDYAVGWLDGFVGGKRLGRGVLHGAIPILTRQNNHSLDLPMSVMGVPRGLIKYALKPFHNRPGMRILNTMKYRVGHNHSYRQSLVQFHFLLDYVPKWWKVYGSRGLIQFQPFVPIEHAEKTFSELLTLFQKAHYPPYLAVLKRHRADDYLVSPNLDGFSLALDFPTPKTKSEKAAIDSAIAIVREVGGKFYLAKDSVLDATSRSSIINPEKLSELRRIKQKLDPDALFTSHGWKRLGIGEPWR